MFGRSSYERSASNIAEHLRGIQGELAKIGIGTQSSQQAANGAAAGVDQVKEIIAAVSPVLEDLAGLLGRGQRYAADRAADMGSRAWDKSSDAAQRMIAQTREQPGFMLAVALGVGILIGLSTQRIVSR